MDGFFTKTVTLSTNALYRARKIDTSTSIRQTSDLWCPPEHLVSQGRFNRIHEPVLYATTVAGAALWEVRPTIGDRVALAICGTVETIGHFKSAHIGLGNYAGAPPTVGGLPNLRTNDGFLQSLKALGVLQKWLRIDRYLAELAMTDEEARPGLYNATCEISEKLSGIPGAVGLIYPSIATGMTALNVRLDAIEASNSLFVSEVWEFEMVRHFSELPGRVKSKPGFALMNPIRRSSSIGSDGTITWANRIDDNLQDEYLGMHKRLVANRQIRALENKLK